MARRDYDTRGVKQLRAPIVVSADISQGSAVDLGAAATKREVLCVAGIGANTGTASLSFSISGSDDNSTWVAGAGSIAIAGANTVLKFSLKAYRYYRVEASTDFAGTNVLFGLSLVYIRSSR